MKKTLVLETALSLPVICNTLCFTSLESFSSASLVDRTVTLHLALLLLFLQYWDKTYSEDKRTRSDKMFVTIWRGGILFSRQKLRDALLQNRVRDFSFLFCFRAAKHTRTSHITLTLSGQWNFFYAPPPPSGRKNNLLLLGRWVAKLEGDVWLS
jgi:hypothetical protein